MSMGRGARQAALEMLERCRRDGAWSGAGVDGVIKKYGLDGRDAALTSRLCLGVLENLGLCDFYIGCYCDKKLEPKLRDILRLGVYQLLFMDKIPARAAVNETVALCGDCGLGRASGLANAVLRRISENMGSLPEIPEPGTAKHLSVKYSHPQWLCEYLIQHQGYAFTEGFLAANNSAPRLTVQTNRLRTDTASLAEIFTDVGLSFELCGASDCIELEGGSAASLPGFDEGLFYVQDRAARAAVSAAGPRPGMRVLDACSSPGGKAFAAAMDMENRGEILCCDIHEKKLGLVRRGAERLGIDVITTKAMDARAFDPAMEKSFDIVIADVPCSGLGVIRKKPEIRYKTWDEISALPQIQREILDNLSRYVRPGGVLLYSTCTVTEEENGDVVKGFLDGHGDFHAQGFELDGLSAPSGSYGFWPNVDGTDGFFVAKLRRKE